ncbi:MAG: lysophospholipid acyltransferase family protein [Gammaproteobacteria bacterium]
MRQWLGSVAFTIYLFVSVPFFALIPLACFRASWETRFAGVRWWVNSVFGALRLFCRLDYHIEGRENLPAQNCVVLVKHSSAWETIAQLVLFPRQTWVLKRELMWLPFFGWVLALLRPIAIDRSARGAAVAQVLEQGAARLAEGFWVIVFPEGTRVPAGESRRYGLSGALLASKAGCPVVPVAHDAGSYWPRRSWLKRPGTIRVVIGEPILAGGRDPRDVNADVRAFIESTLERLAADRDKSDVEV